jgi:hypothetical protein
MEKVKRNGWKLAFLAVAALMCSHVIFGDAANWDPPGPPAPTMTSLEGIYAAVSTASSGIAEREGFCQYFEVPKNSTVEILTVPAGKRFVLLKLHFTGPYLSHYTTWHLTVDDSLFIAGIINEVVRTTETSYSPVHDFPDRCVVVNAGQTLRAVNEWDAGGPDIPYKVHVIGYFCDVP